MKRKLLARIDAEGPVPFDSFMAACLYDADAGFFTSGTLRAGEDGDFLTSPEASPWFGRLLGRWALSHLETDGILVEAAAGSGALLEPLVSELGEQAVSFYATEISAPARAEIKQRVPAVQVVEGIEEIPPAHPAVVIANELLDNLPFRLVDRIGGRWVEFCVGKVDGTLSLEHRRHDSLEEWCDTVLGSAPDGALMTAQTGVETWLTEVLEHFDTLDMCIVDYAGTTSELAERPRNDVVRTYHGHRSGFDFLGEPGATDITCDVNIDAVVSTARRCGASVATTDQRSFLIALGALDVLDELTDLEHRRARAGDVMGQLEVRSEAVNLRTLIDPGGFGGFTVFLINKGTQR